MAFAEGDKATVNDGATDYYGTTLCSFVFSTEYDVIQVNGDRVVIGLYCSTDVDSRGYQVTAAMHESDLNGGHSDPEPTPAPPPEPEIIYYDIFPADKWWEENGNRTNIDKSLDSTGQDINGSAVQTNDGRYPANGYTDNAGVIRPADGEGDPWSDEYSKAIDRNAPSIVQNKYGFPSVKSIDVKGRYHYNYYINYAEDDVYHDMRFIRQAVNIDFRQRTTLFRKYCTHYNKYRALNPNDQLQKTFAHVFFTRPDCNIIDANGNLIEMGDGAVGSYKLSNNPIFYYAAKHNPEILHELCNGTNMNSDNNFMLYLSNKASSLEMSDEYVTTDTYGQGRTGYKIPYGKHSVESRTADKITVNYTDDRDLHIYNLHKIWTEYISDVYRGQLLPKPEHMYNKEIDYMSSIYYILCAEDGETVLFWSKYYGVFPINTPASTLSWAQSNNLGKPEYSIQYQYAFKEDFNPLTLIEFNGLAKSAYQYINPYNPGLLGTGTTWAGAPFVETFNGSKELPYTFKLRFRPDNNQESERDLYYG